MCRRYPNVNTSNVTNVVVKTLTLSGLITESSDTLVSVQTEVVGQNQTTIPEFSKSSNMLCDRLVSVTRCPPVQPTSVQDLQDNGFFTMLASLMKLITDPDKRLKLEDKMLELVREEMNKNNP